MPLEMTLPYRPAAAPRAPRELHWEIEQFLFHEAMLLDQRRYDEWYGLLAEDLHYWVPTRYGRLPREWHLEFSTPDEAAHFDDDRSMIRVRIARLHTNKAWSEDPPSRTRHLVTNVIAHADPGSDLVEADSNFLLYRGRHEQEVDVFAGARHDTLRRAANAQGWELVRRVVILDQTKVLAGNLGVLF